MTDQQKTDHAELGRIAEAADQPMPDKRRAGWWGRKGRFEDEFTPAVCRALLSENATLRAERDEAVRHVTRLADWIEHEVGAELPYGEGETDARTFLQSIARETGK